MSQLPHRSMTLAAVATSYLKPTGVADKLRALAEDFEQAPRQGAAEDAPEGARYLYLSDTVARSIAGDLRTWADRLALGQEGSG